MTTVSLQIMAMDTTDDLIDLHARLAADMLLLFAVVNRLTIHFKSGPFNIYAMCFQTMDMQFI